MQNFSHYARKDDGKANIPKGKGGSTISKDHTKTTMDAMLETSQRLNVADGNGYSVPVQVKGGSNEYSWTKRRKQDASSTLSDGSRSKISALDPNFAKGTYDLTNQRVSMDFDPKELRNAQVNI
jgi:cyclin-dependent kinase 12/13